MHFVSQGIEKASQLPLIHGVDPTAEAIIKAGYKSVGLLGTRFTMEKDFYKNRLATFGINVIVPDDAGRTVAHDILCQELCNGIIKEDSQQKYYQVIRDLRTAGAECVILGCTEIGLLVNEARSELPVFDTTHIHAVAAAADWAMAE